MIAVVGASAIYASGALAAPLATRLAPEANAAVKYWQAFGLMPNVDASEEKILQECKTAPLNADAITLLEKSRNSLAQLRLGAKLAQCDWNLEYSDGLFMLLPHGAKARSLARIAALDARHEFDQGHWAAGADDVVALLRMARHLELDPVMVVQSMGYGIERLAVEVAAPYVPSWKSIKTDAVSAALNALPPGPTYEQIFQTEKQVGPIWLLKRIKDAESREKGGWQKDWNEIIKAIATATEGADGVSSELARSAQTYEQATAAIENLLPLYDEMAKLTAAPANERASRLAEFHAKAKSASPLAIAFLPAAERVVAAGDRNRAQLELFKAAVAVARSGRQALTKYPDPFGDGPFQYRALGHGFELKSKLIYQGSAVSLAVGRR
jgi:hypothetical protein